MEAMKQFCIWFLSSLPDFLMSEPICYFVGLAFGIVIVGLLKSLININRF